MPNVRYLGNGDSFIYIIHMLRSNINNRNIAMQVKFLLEAFC